MVSDRLRSTKGRETVTEFTSGCAEVMGAENLGDEVGSGDGNAFRIMGHFGVHSSHAECALDSSIVVLVGRLSEVTMNGREPGVIGSCAESLDACGCMITMCVGEGLVGTITINL